MMNLKNMKEQFPKMPGEMRAMIKNEVAKQIKTDSCGAKVTRYEKRRRIPVKRMVLIAAAAAMVLGTTVFAGTKLYQIYSEKTGSYGLKTFLGSGNSENRLDVPEKIPVVEIKKNYIPEGMVNPENDPQRIAFEDNLYEGGISMMMIVMDEKISTDNFLLDTDVIYSENLSINGHDAVYLERNTVDDGTVQYDKRFYVAYPEVWHILQVYVGSNVTKEEAMKVVENTEIVSSGETTELSNQYTWSQYVQETNPSAEEVLKIKTEGIGKQTASTEEMAKIHAVGESFAYETGAFTTEGEWTRTDEITAKVTGVQIGNDLSMLGESGYISERLRTQIGEDGKILPNTISYKKAGDGVNTLDEVLRTEEMARKLVYVTVEFTNTGEQEWRDITYLGTFVSLTEWDDVYEIYNRSKLDNDERTDFYTSTRDGGTGKEFTEGMLNQGFVDVRQE